MKQYNHLLKIEHPCSQNWDAMDKIDSGKYCLHCAKNVTDFTTLTDNEIIKIIEQSEGTICGRLQKRQLNRILVNTTAAPAKQRFYKIAAAATLLLSGNNIIAREQTLKTDVITVTNEQGTKEIPQTGNPANVIEGKIVDSTSNETLIGVTISIKGTSVGTMSDLDGTFRLVIPDYLLNDVIVLNVSYIGFDPVELSVRKNELPAVKNIALYWSKLNVTEITEVGMIVDNRHRAGWWKRTIWKIKNKNT